MPFAGYRDFADCVARNQHKQDPQGYCATIMRAATRTPKPLPVSEGETKWLDRQMKSKREQAEADEKEAQWLKRQRAEAETPPKANQHTGWWKGHL